jgi:SagB-type dehydrogenase family enzyme
MAITRLQSPVPRAHPLKGEDIRWSTDPPRTLTAPMHPGSVDVFPLLNGRRTHRHFRSLTARDLSTFLWYSARTRFAYLDESGRRFESRPAPSAGGCHPHDLLIVRPRHGNLEASVYDSRAHALAALQRPKTALQRFVSHVADAVPPEQGTIIWLVAQPQRTQNYYRSPESLLWRDAGVLIGVMAVVADALNLAFCPVGATGDPHIGRLLGTRSSAYGFGGAILGRLAAAPRSSTRRSSGPQTW